MQKRKPKKLKVSSPRTETAHGRKYEVTEWSERRLVDMRLYYRTVDWAQMWEDWYLGVNSDGTPRYDTLRSFIKDKSESKQQTKFLYWYLGPDDVDAVEDAKQYKGVGCEGPIDYVHKRRTGGWFCDKNMKALASDISRRMNALDALKEAGNRVTLHSLLRAGQLQLQLDDAFKGQFFLPGLSMKANEDRARTYIDLHEKLLNMMGTAQDLYAKSHGINFADMAGLSRLMEAAALSAAQQDAITGKTQTREQKALTALVEMTITKHQRYGMVLPPDAETAIVETVAVLDEKSTKPKKYN